MPQYQGVWNLQDAARLQSQQSWVTDPNFRNTTLLLQADNAANSAQNNTFLDSSSNSFSITRNGGNPGMTQGTFTPFSQGWSMYCASSGSTTVAVFLNGESDFAFGTGDFTIEMFVNLASTAAVQAIYDSRPTGTNGLYPTIYLDTSVNKLKYYTNSADRIIQTSAFTYNVWHHVVVTRTGTNTKMFIDGVQEGSTYTDSNNYINTTNRPITGNGQAGDSSVVGYLSNLRVVKGSGPYQSVGSSITVPTAPLTPVANTVLLTLQSNRFVDTNTQAAAKVINPFNNPSVQPFAPFAPQFQYTQSVIGGSGFFDGSGDYLTVPSTSSLAMGTGDYCIEMWIYPTALSGDQTLYANFASGGGNSQIGVFIRNANSIRVSSWDTAFLDSAAGTIVGNSWQHIVNCRSGNNAALFINGVRRASASGTPNNFSSTDAFSIGRRPANDQFFPGYISGLRAVKGSSVYDPTLTTLTVPTAPPTAVTNTQLLLNFTNAGIIDGTMDNVLETLGNAQVSTGVVKYGSGSMYFDGSGDRLFISPNQNLAFGSGDFTVECWVYINSLATNAPIVCFGDDGASTGLLFYVTTAGRIAIYGNNTSLATGTTQTVTTGSWFHLAMSRSGTSLRLFVNGINDGTATNSTSFSSSVLIGAELFTGSIGAQLFGYLDDFRITKGVARYLSNFTPPQVALPRQ